MQALGRHDAGQPPKGVCKTPESPSAEGGRFCVKHRDLDHPAASGRAIVRAASRGRLPKPTETAPIFGR